MCGRVKQDDDPAIYFDYIRWNPLSHMDFEFRPSSNVPPGSGALVLHRLGDGAEQASTLFLGYKPPWYKRSPASNARLDTDLKRSPFWKPLLARKIVMAIAG